MALIFVEPFDQYTNAADMVSSRGYNNGGNIETTVVKDGRASLRIGASGNTLTPILPGADITGRVVLGFWFYKVGTSTSKSPIIGFDDGSTIGELNLMLDTSNRLIVVRGNPTSGVVVGTSSGAVADSTWMFLEFRGRMNNSISADDVVVRLFENEVINVTAGTDTSSFNNYIRYIKLWGPRNGVTASYQDSLLAYSASGTRWNADTFEGQHRFQELKPNGNGTTNDFVGSDADSTDNYLHVDEDSPYDGDTSFNDGSTAADVDLYAHGNITGSPPSVLAVQSFNVAKKTDAGARTMRQVCRSGGSNYFSASKSPSTDYGHFYEVYEDDPDTSSQWTESNVNAAEFGVEVET